MNKIFIRNMMIEKYHGSVTRNTCHLLKWETSRIHQALQEIMKMIM